MNLVATFRPPQMNISFTPKGMCVTTGIPVAREYVGGEPYEGDYIVTPLANSAVILPTNNKILHDDVTVKKVPYFETSNVSGTTAYIASGV